MAFCTSALFVSACLQSRDVYLKVVDEVYGISVKCQCGWTRQGPQPPIPLGLYNITDALAIP